MKNSTLKFVTSRLTIGLALAATVGCTQPQGPIIDGKPAKFVTEAQILIIRKAGGPAPANAPKADVRDEDYIVTQMIVLRSPTVIEEALTKLDKETAEKLDAKAVQARLKARRDTEQTKGIPNNIVHLSYFSDTEQEGTRVLQAVIDAYEQFLRSKSGFTDARVMEALNMASQQARKWLNESEAKQHKLIAESEVRAGSQDLIASRIRSISEKSLTTKFDLSDLETRREALEDAEKNNVDAARLAANLWAAKSGLGADKKDVPAAYREHLKTEIAEKRKLLDNLAGMMERESADQKRAAAVEAELKNAANDVARNRLVFDEAVKMHQQAEVRRIDSGYDVVILSKPAVKTIVNGR
jgi:hypothetical protein